MTDIVSLPEGFVGSLDGVESLVLRGWLLNVFAPGSPIPLQVRSGDAVVYRGATGHRRPDLEQMDASHRVAGLAIDLQQLDLPQLTGPALEIWVEDDSGSPLFKAFDWALPPAFLQKGDFSAGHASEARKFLPRTVFAEDVRYMLDTLVLRNPSSEATARHYEHYPAPLWPAAASDLYADLSARSPVTGERLIDNLKKVPPKDITGFFDAVVTTAPQFGFDNPYYNQTYPDVAQTVNPVLHFLLYGRQEMRRSRYLPLRRQGFDASFFPSYFTSLFKGGSSSSHVAAEHVLQVMRKSLEEPAFYGNDEIEAEDKFFAFLAPFQPDALEVEHGMFEAATAYITQTYLSRSDADYASLPPAIADRFNALPQRSEREMHRSSPQDDGVSILTCYYKHRDYFSQAALSVAATIAVTKRVIPWMKVEWLVVNDDPTASNDELLALVPVEIRAVTRIIANDVNSGIVVSQNRAVQESRYDWLVLLDCDDMLFPACLMVLDHYCKLAPARYYSSRCIDIGENNEVLRFRQRTRRQMDEISSGLHAGHLKMIHKSVFVDLGEFPEYVEGCQDYWLALEVCKRERIVYLPEHLYYYRWHTQTQSASNATSQAATTRRVKKLVLDGTPSYNFTTISRGLPRPAAAPVHGVIIRTVGDRILELKEAILSCSALCNVQVTAVVVVHAGDDTVQFVRDQLANIACNNYTILPAHDGVSKRGYPLNTGIAYLLDIGADVISILDDDDILLPPMFIAAQMVTDLARHDPDTAYVAVGRTLLKDGPDLIVQHCARPVETIFSYNFITTNSVVISRRAAENTRKEFETIFPSDMHYLEDWVGFMRLIASGARIVYVDDFVGQYTGGSDGNADFKILPLEHQTCVSKAQFQAGQLKQRWLKRGVKQGTPFEFSGQ